MRSGLFISLGRGENEEAWLAPTLATFHSHGDLLHAPRRETIAERCARAGSVALALLAGFVLLARARR